MTQLLRAFLTFIALLPIAFSASAQNSAAKGDPAAGAIKAETCFGCHAAPNYFNVYPSYHVPKLGGQRPEYMVEALKAYQDGLRDHGTMHANAANLSEQDMLDIAAYLASMPTMNVDSNATAPATAGLDKLSICTSCHGPTGISNMVPVPGSIVPHLAGQYADYLAKSLRDYRSGARKHAVMLGMAAGLTDAEIDSLAAYYAGRQGLTVVKKP